jgi:hydrogenase-4 component F
MTATVVLPALVLLPAAMALLAYALRVAAWRSALLVATAAAHTLLVLRLWMLSEASALGGWLAAEPMGLVVLSLVSLLFLAVAHYSVGYVRRERVPGGRAFASCMLAFLAAASLVALSGHFALMWIGLESTTLAVAPLIYDQHDRRSLEAVWKYLVLSSVGIAFALLGVFLLAAAQPSGAAGGRPLILADLLANAAQLDPAWLRLAFVFLAIGFGTKMGLAPMHSWKPDTYGEAPPLVAGLMAGALTSCAFLALARASAVCFAAGLADFVQPILLGFGLVSLVIAAAFIVGQRDIRRLLAYSSVEHMGLLVLGLGLGGVGTYGAMLHALNNGLAKGLTFLAVGNVVLASTAPDESNGGAAPDESNGGAAPERSAVRGVLGALPLTSALLIIGLLAVSGSPPFGMFLSEFTILQASFAEGHPWIAAATIFLLVVIFVGIAALILDVVYGEGRASREPPRDGARPEAATFIAGPAMLAIAVFVLGLYIPAPLRDALSRAAILLGGHGP